MSRRLLKDQLARALESLGSDAAGTATARRGGGGDGGGGGGAGAKKAKKRTNNKHALDVKRMNKQAVRARQRAMRRSGDDAPREALGEAAKREVKKRNAAYFAATSGADAETAEHAARAIGAVRRARGSRTVKTMRMMICYGSARSLREGLSRMYNVTLRGAFTPETL